MHATSSSVWTVLLFVAYVQSIIINKAIKDPNRIKIFIIMFTLSHKGFIVWIDCTQQCSTRVYCRDRNCAVSHSFKEFHQHTNTKGSHYCTTSCAQKAPKPPAGGMLPKPPAGAPNDEPYDESLPNPPAGGMLPKAPPGPVSIRRCTGICGWCCGCVSFSALAAATSVVSASTCRVMNRMRSSSIQAYFEQNTP